LYKALIIANRQKSQIRNEDFQIYKFSLATSGTPFKISPLQLTDLEINLSPSGEILIQLIIPDKFASNPIVLLEGLSRLYSIMRATDLKLKFGSHKTKESYKINLDKSGNKVWDGHPELHSTQWNQVEEWSVLHSALKMLGIRLAPSQNGRNFLASMELKLNAESGSHLAQRELAEIELNNVMAAQDSFESYSLISLKKPQEEIKSFLLEAGTARDIDLDPSLDARSLWTSYFRQYTDLLKNDLINKTKLAKDELREYNLKLKAPTIQQKKLYLESLPEKLEALVKKNDRNGVADLLTVYLSLETLEPFEREFWKEQLEAIRHPNFNKSIVLFRGLDRNTDKPQKALDSQGNEVGRGYFSSLFIYNQGSYTYRCRSLELMRHRLGIEMDTETPSSLVSTPKIAAIMRNHSFKANGSPFLSLSSDPKIAFHFSESGILAIRVDARRAVSNLTSVVSSKWEYFVPLIIFPDEIVHFEEGAGPLSDVKFNNGEQFLENFKQKLGPQQYQIYLDSRSNNARNFKESFFQLFNKIQLKLRSH